MDTDLIGEDATPTDEEPPTLSERKLQFLELVAAGMKSSEAAAAIGVSRWTPARWLRTDPEFRKAHGGAREVNIEMLVKEAERRALSSSDKVLMFLLCNYAPDRFKEARHVDLKGQGLTDIANAITAARNRAG